MIKAQSAPALVPISYGLRAMGPAGLAVVRGWLTGPHVTHGWANPEDDHPASEPTRHCLLHPDHRRPRRGRFAGVRPPALLPPAADEQTLGHPYRAQPRGVRGIDLFFGAAKVHRTRLRIFAASGAPSSTSSGRTCPRGDGPRSRECTQRRRLSQGRLPLCWATKYRLGARAPHASRQSQTNH